MAARVLKGREERKAELLDAAQELFIRTGYEGTPVHAVIDRVGVSKGTFYHYFESKEDLLDCLVARLTARILEEIRRETRREGQNAIERLNAFFAASSRWKAAHKAELIAIVRPMYAQENIRLLHKMTRRSVDLGRPELARIVGQGIEEGLFRAEHPEDVAELVLYMSLGIHEVTAGLLLASDEREETWDAVLRKLRTYRTAVERILGAPEGSLHVLDEASISAFRPGGREGAS